MARLRKFLFSRGKSFYKWFLLEITFFSLSNFGGNVCVYIMYVYGCMSACVLAHICVEARGWH